MTQPNQPAGLFAALRAMVTEPLTWLLLACPIAVGMEWAHFNHLAVFIACCVAIIPLAGVMGRATENLAETMGAGIGGLMNATFGNAAELIIALMILIKARALPAAEQLDKLDIVKASITGSIIGNILLVLGLSILAGGIRFRRQSFNRTAASLGATLLALSTIGLLLPTVFFYLTRWGNALAKAGTPEAGAAAAAVGMHVEKTLSNEIACVLGIIYVLSLVFSLRTHSHLFAGEEESTPTTGEHGPEWSRATSLWMLLIATAGVAWMSEILADVVSEAAKSLGMTEVFVGVIVVAIVGNAAEHSTAVLTALKNKMDLSVNIAVGSSLQIALFVAPVLVLASHLLMPSQPLDLHFTPLELIAVLIAVTTLAMVSGDGESHWMEGAMLLGVYLMLALAFYHLPDMRWLDR